MFNFNTSNGPIAILIQFLKNPSKFQPTIPRNKINQHIFAYVFFGITITTIVNLILASIFTEQYESITGLSNQIESLPIPLLAFMLLIYAPFVEELVFRGPLAKGSLIIKRIWLFIIIFVASIFSLLFYVNNLLTFDLDFSNFAMYSFLICSSFAFLVAKFIPIQWLFKSKVFNTLVYFQAIVFGAIHIYNYSFNSPILYYFIPFLIINQLYMGFVASYLSSKYVITKSILTHFINNLFAFCFIIMFDPKMDQTTIIIFSLIAFILFITGFYFFFTLNFNFKKRNIESSQLINN